MILSRDIRSFAIALLGIACCTGEGKLILGSLLLFLWNYIKERKNYNIRESLLFSSEGKLTLISYSVFFLAIGISSIFATGNNKLYLFKYFDRILPLLLFMLLARKDKETVTSALFGMCIGISVTVITAIGYFFEYGWRPRSLLGNPNELASIIVILFPFVVGACSQWFKNKNIKLIGFMTLLFMLLGLFLTQSRGPALSLAIGLIFGGIICYQQNIVDNKKFLLGMIFFILLGTFFLFIIRGSASSSNFERICLWQSSWMMFLDYPIIGVGLDHFNVVYRNGYILPLAKEPTINSPHNIYLHYMVETGILGLLGFLAMIGLQVKYLFSLIQNKFLSKDTLICVICMLVTVIEMLVQGLFDALFLSRDFNIMYWFLWGVTCCSIWIERK